MTISISFEAESAKRFKKLAKDVHMTHTEVLNEFFILYEETAWKRTKGINLKKEKLFGDLK